MVESCCVIVFSLFCFCVCVCVCVCVRGHGISLCVCVSGGEACFLGTVLCAILRAPEWGDNRDSEKGLRLGCAHPLY